MRVSRSSDPFAVIEGAGAGSVEVCVVVTNQPLSLLKGKFAGNGHQAVKLRSNTALRASSRESIPGLIFYSFMTTQGRRAATLSRCFPLLLCISLASVGLHGQAERSSLSGTVTDPGRYRVPAAKVLVRQNATGLIRESLTTSEGTYQINELPAGMYSVTVEKTGFATLTADDVFQSIGQNRTLDVQLSVSNGSGRAEVSEPLVQIDRSSAVLGAPIEQSQLHDLPLNGRNWSSLTALTPGAVDTGLGDQRTIRFAGHGLDDNQVLFDGVDASGILNQAQKEYVRLAIPLDSISEFEVLAQNYNADVGMTTGGQVSVVSPSGTNMLHGSAFEYLRNSLFDARPFTDNRSSPSAFLLNQFGADLSDSIVQDKTFFFANYEGLRQHLGQTQIGLAPSPAFLTQAATQSPALAPILAAYPAGTSPTGNPQVWNYVAGAKQVDNEDSGMLRLDQHFDANNTAFVRYSEDEADYTIPTGALNALSNTDTKLRNGVVDYFHVFSPALINDFKFGVNQDIYHTANLTQTPFAVSVPGFSPLTSSSTTDGAGTTFSWLDDMTRVVGRHVLKFGLDVRRIQMNQGNSASGTLTYNSQGNFLDGTLDGAAYTSLLPLKRLRKTQYYAYIQDEFKASPNLTLTLGLRYSFFNVFHETDGRAVPFDFATCGGYCPSTDSFSHPRSNDFDPRAAVAWAHKNTAVRFGAGLYHSDGQEDDQNLPISNDIARYTLTAAGSPRLAYPINPFLQAATGVISPRDLYRDRKDMYVAAWNASLQQMMPGKLVGTLSYVGNKGTDILTTTYVNLLNPLTQARPYPAFGVVSWRGNDSNSTFHALQANARRAFQNGLSLQANYMWSHSINDDGIGGGESDNPQNVFCRACEKASSDFDVRQLFNAGVVYQLPFGANQRFLTHRGVAQTLLGGWQIDTISTARTGLPVNVTIDRLNASVPGGYSVAGYERPNLVSGVSLIPATGQTPGLWINPAAFTTPANGSFGNAGRNLVRAPDLWQVDLALARVIVLSERMRIQARAESFNVFNRAQYGSPLADLSSPLNFGRINTPLNQGATGSGTPRQFQFALRFIF